MNSDLISNIDNTELNNKLKYKLKNKLIDNNQKFETSKTKIAHIFIIGYGILLIFIFIVPLIIYLYNDNIDLTSFKEIVTLYNGLLASLTGMLGFVVGYYFNSKSS